MHPLIMSRSGGAVYTRRWIADLMLDAVGYTPDKDLASVRVLEPSCGIGNFIGALPEEMRGSRVYGVELDSVSGRIAQQLYQKQNISVTGFENTAFPDSFFDVAVGNVPFGQFKVLDPKYNRYNFLIHDYFFAKTLDKVRPGGIVAMLTSKGIRRILPSAATSHSGQTSSVPSACRRIPSGGMRGQKRWRTSCSSRNGIP